MTVSAHVSYNYNDAIREMDRRAAVRQATAQFRLSIVSIAIAVTAVIVAALR